VHFLDLSRGPPPCKRTVSGSIPLTGSRSDQRRTPPHLGQQNGAAFLISPAGYGSHRLSTASHAKYAPKFYYPFSGLSSWASLPGASKSPREPTHESLLEDLRFGDYITGPLSQP
jgi:hypothetical protein